ncbi:MAG: FecR domain-containing protein [Pseudomonadota bacterium]
MNIRQFKLHILLVVILPCMVFGSQLSGCKSCNSGKAGEEQPAPDAPTAPPPDETMKDKIHDASVPIQPEAEVVGSSGAFNIVRSEKKSKFPVPKGEENSMYIGDRIATEADGRVELSFPTGGKATLASGTELIIGTHLSAEIVVVRGNVVLETNQIKGRSRRFKVQTPTGTFYHAGPSSEISVARNGATRIFVSDCPDASLPAAKLDPAKPLPAVMSGCAYLFKGEEKMLASGDLLIIDSKLGETLVNGHTDTGEMSGKWLAGENGAFESSPEEQIDWYIQWLPGGIEKIEQIIGLMDELRDKNKGLIQDLRDLRKDSKETEPAKAQPPAQKKPDKSPAKKKMDDVKLNLAENSKRMARLRETLLAKWYQLILRWDLLNESLTDEILSKGGKDRSVMEAFITSFDEKILKIVHRRPKRKVPGKFPLPSMQRKHLPLDAQKGLKQGK